MTQPKNIAEIKDGDCPALLEDLCSYQNLHLASMTTRK